MTKTKRKPKAQSGVTLSVKAKRKGGPSGEWPHDDSMDVYRAVTRALERRGCGRLDGGGGETGNGGEFVIESLIFYTKSEKQARKLLADAMSELAHGWTYSAKVSQ